MDVIFNNQELVVTVLSLVITWVIAMIWKKNANRAAIIVALNQILDIVQDIANAPDTRHLDDAAKKDLAVSKINSSLPNKRKTLIGKVFGGVGGAVEFVWKNRKMLVPAAVKLVKVVF
ncbi:MAG: hypothetical protein LHW43_06870 [Candidatus Cloacimonetes bacterium]|nr:hypothetical protein [Candidatus Cloacimonadota bacterium]